MRWRKGLQIFQEKGEEAIEKELKQIHNMEGFQPKHSYKLTKEDRVAALKYLIYLKEKRDGRWATVIKRETKETRYVIVKRPSNGGSSEVKNK